MRFIIFVTVKIVPQPERFLCNAAYTGEFGESGFMLERMSEMLFTSTNGSGLGAFFVFCVFGNLFVGLVWIKLSHRRNMITLSRNLGFNCRNVHLIIAPKYPRYITDYQRGANVTPKLLLFQTCDACSLEVLQRSVLEDACERN